MDQRAVPWTVDHEVGQSELQKTWGTASSNVGDDHVNDLELDAPTPKLTPVGSAAECLGCAALFLFLVVKAAYASPSVATYTSNREGILGIHTSKANKPT